MKPVLAVINGGGCRQIECATGILQALDAAGIRIDRYTGSSAGAAVAALHASGNDGETLELLIRVTPARELFRPCWMHQALSLFGVPVDHIFDASGMYRMLLENMTGAARSNVRVAVTRLRDYAAMMCDATPETVMASAAIPEVFPAVEIQGEKFVDGGVKNMIPTPKISEIGDYEHIYILLCNDDAPGPKPKTRIGRGIEAFSRTMDRETCQLYEEGWHELPNVTVIQPPPFPSSLLDWSEDYKLIEHARNYAATCLRRPGALRPPVPQTGKVPAPGTVSSFLLRKNLKTGIK